MPGTTDDARKTRETPPAPPPSRAPAGPQPATPAAARLSVIWLRDTKPKPEG